MAEIRGFASNFAPRAWALCEGQILTIASNTALFSLLGMTYGGDGRTTFALPDLRGRVPIGAGQGPGLFRRDLGDREGTEREVLTILEMPSHNHSATSYINGTVNAPISGSGSLSVSNAQGTSNTPINNYPAKAPDVNFAPTNIYSSASNGHSANDAVSISGVASIDLTGLPSTVIVNDTGGTKSHNNMQPYLTISWIICMMGVFPSRT